MAYPKFTPTKEFYLKYRGKNTMVGKKLVSIGYLRTESRGGSWERGFRFYESEWALLVSNIHKNTYRKPTMYSMDHGKTWHPTTREARKSKGKLRLSTENHGELAFEGIQRICREWDGPEYKWHR